MAEDPWFRRAQIHMKSGQIIEHDSVAVMTLEGVYLRSNGPGRVFIPANDVAFVCESSGYGRFAPEPQVVNGD